MKLYNDICAQLSELVMWCDRHSINVWNSAGVSVSTHERLCKDFHNNILAYNVTGITGLQRLCLVTPFADFYIIISSDVADNDVIVYSRDGLKYSYLECCVNEAIEKMILGGSND
jgi:hypothetical protein